MTTATATVLFTDVEGSTEMRARIGEAAADRVFLDHERLMTAVVTGHHGRVLKTAGDGVMAAFDSASDAVIAAVEMQRKVARAASDLRIRVGVAAGDVSWEGNDCFGLPVITAARLQAAAGAGDILVSQVVRWLAGDRAGAQFTAAGPLELKGLPEPVEAYHVMWEDEAGEQIVPLPPTLAVPAEFAFVGRDSEWQTLEDHWRRVQGGDRRVVLIGGEAGAGKTRLAAEYARGCHDDGAVVLFGACDAEGAVPYQPWVQSLQHLLRTFSPDDVDDDVVNDLGGLAALLPPLDRRRRAMAGAALDADSERYRLFGAIDALLAWAGQRAPLVLVLDDLHWASAETLALLARIARTGTGARTLVIGTFRDTGDELTEPLAGTLADLRRVDNVARLRLAGLDEGGVATLVAEATGHALGPDMRQLAAAVATRSRGNAFFVGELWRHVIDIGIVTHAREGWVVRGTLDDAGVPDSVREVVADRLARLPFAVRRLADLVAVAGPRVELDTLRIAADVPTPELAAHLDQLVTADLLEVVERPRLTYRFSHALVRDTVEAGIPPAARAGLHLRVAEALETAHESDRRPVLGELARHFTAAASLGTLGKAVYYGRQAAEQAWRSVAFDEALDLLTTVLDLTDPGSAARADVLMAIGWTEMKRSRFDAAVDAYRGAFELACERGDVAVAAEAALGFEDALHTPGMPGEPAVRIVNKAIEMVGDARTPLRARLQAALARSLTHAGNMAEAWRVLDSALALARELGDTDALGAALEAAIIAEQDPNRMLEYANELEAIAGVTEDGWRLSYSTTCQMRSYLMLGDFDKARSTLARHWSIGAEGRFLLVQIQAHGYDISLCLADGRFDDAEARAERCFELGSETGGQYAAGVYGLQMFVIRREQGRLAEVRGLLEAVSRQPSAGGVWRPGLAVLYSELGMLDDARREFGALAPGRFAAVPRDAVWPGCLSFLSDVCAALDDSEHAAVLYDELLAYAGQNLLVGMTVCLGPADRLLGVLASVLGRAADAEAHFELAFAMAERCESPVWRAHTQLDWARARAAVGDAPRAAALASEALDTATEFGMGTVAERCDELLRSLRLEIVVAAPSLPDGLSAREVDVLRLVAAGRSNREIGERLLISGNTAANHVRAILQKTGCANRAEAATYAVRRGLLDE